MSDAPVQQKSSSESTGSLDDILTTLQQGVQAINNLTQALSAIVIPST